jgi:MFS family permease
VESATRQGVLIIGAAIMWTLGQVYAARNAGRSSSARMVVAGFCLLSLGALLVAPTAFGSMPAWATFAAWSVGGLGMGMLFNPTTLVAMSATTDDDAGLVSSQLNMADYIGFASSGALGGAFVAISHRTTLSINAALLSTFVVGTVLAALGALLVARHVVADPGPGSTVDVVRDGK